MMPVRLWDTNGQKVWQGNADAWGNCQPETLNNAIHQPLRLPGQFEDELTGIVQNRFRDYDPSTGRYLTPDPYGIKGGLNAYRYTKNPLDYVDPLGLEFQAVVTADNAHAGEDAPVLGNLEPMQEVPVPESQLSQQYLHETVGLDTVVVGPDGHGETIGALYSKVYDPEGNQLPGVDNQAVEAFNDAYRQAESISETRAEGYTMAAQDVAVGVAAGPVAGVVAGAAKTAAGTLVNKAKSALGLLRKTAVPDSKSLIKRESGGTLVFHENLGGHTIRKHVGRTDQQLLQRFEAEPDILGSSTYPDIETAQRVIGDVLSRNQSNIQDWLTNSPKPRLSLNETLEYEIGRVIPQGDTLSQSSNKSFVLLIKDPLTPKGYRVHTSFPKAND
ncbi:RNase A-like domain-containing protein [Marinobacter sp. ANT_B65]|uniref:RNase A-like domain-containing protein n=1 Tax=Marinobacter sp. ANT_B65 TaxID=2039467 RepID=UPI000BBEB488|nr:RNase A-like domain-containing protein [Marinobacter sp. ANT_B65]PCM44854.1 hypothetical protein CPA50_02135 [Marinobacter sp. ANT_B65]